MGCMLGMTPFPRWTESLPVFTTSSLRKQCSTNDKFYKYFLSFCGLVTP